MSVDLRGIPIARPTPLGDHYKGDRALSANEVGQLIAALDQGTSIGDVARTLGVSRRTVYRWRNAEIIRVDVGDWYALFAIRPGTSEVRPGPVQMSAWYPRGES